MSDDAAARPHKRSKDDGSSKDAKVKFTRLSRKPIQGGRGIFVTCIRGKQQRAAAETVDLLEQIAEVTYPQERLQQLEQHRQERDSLLASTRTSLPEAVDAPDCESDVDESIEASIERELAQLKANASKHKGKSKADDGVPKGKRKKLAFESIETDTECRKLPTYCRISRTSCI
ncbi:hypothetical protein OIV83_003357 [Microbotryomycetes sp. JL201]|nr:hypothetical protein OIV83_003357 [Microbotryomycetes sp. JL201]